MGGAIVGNDSVFCSPRRTSKRAPVVPAGTANRPSRDNALDVARVYNSVCRRNLGASGDNGWI